MTERCLQLVKKFEGFSAVPYLCPAGYWTVGYGHVLSKYKQMFLTQSEAEQLLIEDLFKVERMIKPMIKVEVHPYMLDALISFSFNCGVYAFRASTLRRLLNQREFYYAAEQFLRWVYANGRKLKGLILRRKAEKELFLEGVNYG